LGVLHLLAAHLGGQLGDRLLALQVGGGRRGLLRIDFGLRGIAADAEIAAAGSGDHPGRRGGARRRCGIRPRLLAWARKSALSGASWLATLTRATSSVGRLGVGLAKWKVMPSSSTPCSSSENSMVAPIGSGRAVTVAVALTQDDFHWRAAR